MKVLKDATRTIGIIWGVLATIVALALIIVASNLSANNTATLEQLIAGGMTEEEALAAIQATAAVVFVFAFVSLGSAVYSVVLATLVYRKGLNRLVGIVLGAIAIAIFALVPGVLFIVDSLRNRTETGAKEIEEPKEEEATEKKK
ncbi:MAG: hypothetical protein IJS52_10405 [Bacilli bacterium]|nr:hypothetical protein [Bacilli bacterium]